MTIRLAPVVFTLSLAGIAPALAYEAPFPGSGEVPCSALCRSWMSLGQVPAPSDEAPATDRHGMEPPLPARLPIIASPARPPGIGPDVRAPDKRRPAARVAVPLPPRRPVPAIAEPPRAALAGVAPPAPPLPAPVIVRAEAPTAPAARIDKPAAVETPAAAIDDTRPQIAVASMLAPAPVRGGDFIPAPAAVPRPAIREDAPAAPAPRGHATPWSLRLGIYAVLAGLFGWGFRRPREPRPAGALPSGSARRRRPSVRKRERRAQHPAVDAL